MYKLVTIIPISNFSNSKTRLSPFLSEIERKELLKCMLKDIVSNIRSSVEEIIVISKDEEVLEYAQSLGLKCLNEREHESDYLNNSLLDSISYVKDNYSDANILMLPADIPLIKQRNIQYILENKNDFIISPSKGGGTNLLYINNEYNFKPQFGEFSFFKHVDEARRLAMNPNIYDSFYLSIDINTPQDLGELLLHGKNTYTFKYLNSLDIVVENNHGGERLNVYRKNE